MKRAPAALALAIACGALPLSAAEPLPTPLDHLGAHAVESFQGSNLVLYGAALTSTGALAFAGIDHSFRVAMQRQVDAPLWEDLAVQGGFVAPLVISGGLYLAGVATHEPVLAGPGSAAVQALALAFTTTIVLKAATGRPFPLYGSARDAPDQLEHPERAREFFRSPFDLHLAWPSGHTSAAFSIAAALSGYFPESIAVPLVGYPLSVGVGIGMIAADTHWASDVVAGALIGQAIGWTVGSGFRRRTRSSRGTDHARWMIVPLLDGSVGAAVVASH